MLEDDRRLWSSAGSDELREIALPSPGDDGHPSLAPMRLWAHEIIDAIRTGRPCSPSFEDGLRCQTVMDAMYRSHGAGGGWVPVEPGVAEEPS